MNEMDVVKLTRRAKYLPRRSCRSKFWTQKHTHTHSRPTALYGF